MFGGNKRILFACPKTGKRVGRARQRRWPVLLLPIAGLLSLIWFLIRVIPKPSRATYPCQRFAAPLASGFVAWLAGLIGSALAYRRARQLLHQSRYVFAAICVAISVLAVWASLSLTTEQGAEAAFTPSDPPNSPMGVAKGIHPGRVVWVHEPAAANWDGSTGNWWDENNTDQGVVDYMVSQTLRTLTGQASDTDAWDALFKHFNQTRGFGDVGYQNGERVTIKINMNQDDGGTWSRDDGMPSPQAIHSMLDQLINVVGVPGSLITVYDASRRIGDPIYNKIRSNPDPDFQAVRFVANTTYSGRIRANRDTANPLYTRAGTAYLPQCVTQAKYLINMALFRPHSLYGVTLCAKNHFGSVYFNSWTPEPLHSHGGRSKAMNTYNCLVNLNGHRHLSGKTLLYMIDALYGAINQNNRVVKYSSFGDDWCSSIFASQDPVAIDSVGLDFLRYEDPINPAIVDVTGYPDNYLHEMALANDPPSGTVYDPEQDGTRLGSLGVHEHWNNPTDKQYSRNLRTGDGIELVVPALTSEDGPVENLTKRTRYDYVRNALKDADPGDEIVVGAGTYYEDASFMGKSVTLRSIDPDDPAVVAATIIEGRSQAVTFSGGEQASCILTGLTITGAGRGIYCFGASPTITKCRIVDNRGAGIKLWEASNPTISNCVIAGNGGTGVEMWASTGERFIKYNYATITNCAIVGNLTHGVFGGMPTISSSILYDNGWACDFAQIDCYYAAVDYSNVQGSFAGTDNMDAAPCFVVPGHWADSTDPSDPNAVWVHGDYHLQWDSPCINAGDPDLTAEAAGTDVDGEPRVLVGRIDMGSDEVGEKQADFTRDGVIDTRDLAMFVQGWLADPGQQSWDTLCDLNGDSHIDLADWRDLATDWRWRAEWCAQ